MFDKILVGWRVSWGWGRGIGGPGLLLGEDGLTLVLDVSDVAVLVDGVGHDLDAGVRKSDPVGSGGLVAIPSLQVAEVVGVGVVDGVLEVVGRSGVRVDLNDRGRAISGGRSRGIGRTLGPSSSSCNQGRENKDLEEEAAIRSDWFSMSAQISETLRALSISL